MANKKLFKTTAGKLLPMTDALNHEFAPAYKFSPEHALAQYAVTGCLNGTFYAGAEEQLAEVIKLCQNVAPEFIAKTAVYARERGFMKDMPALLCAVLAVRDVKLLAAIFPRVIDNGKMLRNFVQILRSGVAGRKSLGSAPKRMVREWFESRGEEVIFKESVGQSPSFADILKMVHPKPQSASREALYGYFIGHDHNADALPPVVRRFEAYKAGDRAEVPNVPFQMLTALELGTREWTEIARRASWQMTRMNLNTFARHGVFREPGMLELIADRLRDPQAIRKAKVFPYQLMVAYKMIDVGNAEVGAATPRGPFNVLKSLFAEKKAERRVAANDADVSRLLGDALQDAMEIAVGNVPEIAGKVYVLPDISGSMHSPVTGYRRGATSKVRCVDVAALVAAAVLRRNAQAEVIPFESDVVQVKLNPRDSVMTNAEKLSSLPCGGTNCSAPLAFLNKREAKGDLVIYVSDSESWIDAPHYGRFGGSGTETMKQWARFKQRNPHARMVCLDIQPYGTSQAQEREDILNIGGFSDRVFDVIAEFAAGRLSAGHWVGVIEAVQL
jgi:60 kDa SS-A/Ro ribonucleoprotein